MPPKKSLTGRSQPAAASTAARKRKAQDQDLSDKENIDNTAPKQRKSNTKAKIPTNHREATKLYKDTIKAIDTRTDKLDREVKKLQCGNSYAITTDNYATATGKHVRAARKLADLDLKVRFNLLMAMADASHCSDLNATIKMCGTECGSSQGVFELIDEALLEVIESRADFLPPTTAESTELPKVPARCRTEDADVGEFKTGHPNKQQRNWMYAQKLEHEKKRRMARRQRREEADNWAAVALSDLEEERDYLKKYGVEGYFPDSIARLEELTSGTGK